MLPKFWFILVITYGGVFEGEESRIPFPDAKSCGDAILTIDKTLNLKGGAKIEMIQCKESEMEIVDVSQ